MIRVRVLASLMLLALTSPMAAQSPQKKFMAAPVTIEDQGSFFIGGVTKVSEFAAAPGHTWRRSSRSRPLPSTTSSSYRTPR